MLYREEFPICWVVPCTVALCLVPHLKCLTTSLPDVVSPGTKDESPSATWSDFMITWQCSYVRVCLCERERDKESICARASVHLHVVQIKRHRWKRWSNNSGTYSQDTFVKYYIKFISATSALYKYLTPKSFKRHSYNLGSFTWEYIYQLMRNISLTHHNC